MSMVALKEMRKASAWEDPTTLKRFCASQLLAGRLSIVLGAGVSMACGLPDWATLVNRCFAHASTPRPANLTEELAAEFLLTESCSNNEQQFSRLVHKALYEAYSSTGIQLSKVDMVAALGALVTPSARGGVCHVVSFNFDDLLEQFLTSFGVCVDSLWQLPAWESRADVRVYHPHGFLPFDTARGLSKGIVMALNQYNRIVGNSTLLWRQKLLGVLRSNTCIFIGISGNDQNLQSLIQEARDSHSNQNEHPFWAVRLGKDDNDPNKLMWHNRGVFHHSLQDYSNLPPWLFDVCQSAAAIQGGS
jgi:hypothetical protein